MRCESVRPMPGNILVKPKEPSKVTQSGKLALPDSVVEQLKKSNKVGTVLAATPYENPNRDLQVKEGDKIMYSQYAGNTVEIDGQLLLVMPESDIWLVIE